MRVFLTQEEERTLWELRTAESVAQQVKDRAEAVRLSHQGWYVEQIAKHLPWHISTVRKALKSWMDRGLGGLWEQQGRGRKPRWTEADMTYLESCLRGDKRTYNSAELAEKLEAERQVQLSSGHLRQVLKKRG
jgi:transposase